MIIEELGNIRDMLLSCPLEVASLLATPLCVFDTIEEISKRVGVLIGHEAYRTQSLKKSAKFLVLFYLFDAMIHVSNAED